MKAESYAAGTIINALATFKGVAFGIDLKIRGRFRENDSKRLCIVENGKIVEMPILYKIFRNISGVIEIESEIPRRSGLGSSSAFMNVLLILAAKIKGEKLNAEKILKANARMSLETGMSYTGAFDDASASLLGGVVFSDNLKMKLFKREILEGDVIILLPDFKRGEINLRRIREDKEIVERAFKLAMEGKFKEAMLLNSMHYCRKIGLPLEPVISVQDLNVAAGLSGNGPCYVAFGEDVSDVESIWKNFGKTIRKRIVNEPAEDVRIPKTLFW
uniref:Shikimate kinase n=1 Tax=Geoglobus ahangari TaxID=113653 RepID=A0A7C4W424_9EURY